MKKKDLFTRLQEEMKIIENNKELQVYTNIIKVIRNIKFLFALIIALLFLLF